MSSQIVAAEVRAIIARGRLPQAMVAEKAGLTGPQLSRRLHGHTPFTADDVSSLAGALGVTVAQLYGEPAAQSDAGAPSGVVSS